VVWDIVIRNDTRGWTFNTTVPYSSAGQTAEWIMEAPLSAGTSGAGQTSLSNYGIIGFGGASANGANPELTGDDAVAMVDADGNVISNPSGPAASGDAFVVCFGPGSCP
jgi:hypothetical protein